MQSTAKNVTSYLEEVPAERKVALIQLRKLCLVTLKGFEESMQYGGPCYSRNGVVESVLPARSISSVSISSGLM
jgi:hypothetical protein